MRVLQFTVLLFSLQVFSQNYIPIDTTDHTQRDFAKQQYEKHFELLINKIDEKYSGKTRREMVSFYEELESDFVESIETGQFVYKTSINAKLNDIYVEICTNNPEVPKDLDIFLSKNLSLNALCLPDGTLVVYMGAIYYLQNEDQLASVLCHEIGHYLLSHNEKYTAKRIKETNSKTNKRKIREIRKGAYNRMGKASDMLRKKLYAKGEEKRKNELQADSIGYILFKNTKYNKLEVTKALNLFMLYDTIKPKGLELDIYRNIFNLPKQPFSEKWLEREDFSKYDYSLYDKKFSMDSLQTHPSEKKRIVHLKTLFPELQEEAKSNSTTKEFEELQDLVKKEQLPNLYFQEEYGTAIYLALYRIQQGYMENYHKDWLGKSFQKIYEARKNYTTNSYLEHIIPNEQTESYKQFLSFMWNLNIDEIKIIADFYSNIEDN